MCNIYYGTLEAEMWIVPRQNATFSSKFSLQASEEHLFSDFVESRPYLNQKTINKQLYLSAASWIRIPLRLLCLFVRSFTKKSFVYVARSILHL